MKKTIFAFIAVFLIGGSLNAQNHQNGNGQNKGPQGPPIGVVTGIIVDSKTSNPIEYANVVLYKAKDSTLVTGGVTNTKGVFNIDKVPFGGYYLKVNFIGYAPQIVPDVKVTPKAPEVNVGKIKFQPGSTSLTEVTITSEKKLVEYTLDKKVINVEKNIATTGGTAVDVMKNVPSVTVDVDGNVSLRGNGNITILIDGRPSAMTGASRSAVLEQIPASSIESIEIITNPSARYQAEGMTGIINIKLKKKMSKGFNGIISANIGTGDKYNGSINLNYNLGKVNFFASIDGSSRIMDGWMKSTRENTLNDSTTKYIQSASFQRFRQGAGVKFGTDFFINSKNAITISFGYENRSGKNPESFASSAYNLNNSLLYYNVKNSTEDEEEISKDLALNYKKIFKRKEQSLTADIIYNNSGETNKSDLSLQDYNLDSTIANTNPALENANDYYNNYMVSAQTDYIHPFDSTSRFETGYKYINRNMDQDYLMKNYLYPTTEWINDTTKSNHFIYNEQVHAVYVIYSKIYKKFSYQIGVRAEQTMTTADQKTDSKKYTNDYLGFFPSAHVTKKFGKDNDIQISYSRRINRPDIHSLNPFIDYGNPLQIRYGNPELKPEYINSYEIGHTKYWKKSSINSSLFYKQIYDVIKNWSFLDTNGVTHSTSMNMSKGTSYGIEMIFDLEILKWWKVNASGSYFRTIIDGSNMETNLTNDNYSWTARIGSNISIAKICDIQITGFYNGPMVSAQGQMNEMYSMDIGAKKDFFKNRLSVSLRCSDVFNTMKYDFIQSGDGFSFHNTRKRETRIGFLGISYKINGGIKQKNRKRPTGNEGDNNGGDNNE